jgi:hypothetical protein
MALLILKGFTGLVQQMSRRLFSLINHCVCVWDKEEVKAKQGEQHDEQAYLH